MFQFHKVRLKANTSSFVILDFNVSIPQGTIKREKQTERKAPESMFQFHKVRLKENKKLCF